MTVPLMGNDSLPPQEAMTATAVQATALAEEIAQLREAAGKLTRRTGRNELTVRLAVGGLILDVLLSLCAFFLLYNQSAQNAQLQASIHEQCSLYGLLIPSYRESSRVTSPLGPEGYDNAFRGIQRSADNLQCGIAHKVPGS